MSTQQLKRVTLTEAFHEAMSRHRLVAAASLIYRWEPGFFAQEGSDFAGRLEERTFFSELLKQEALRGDLWPEPPKSLDLLGRVREREQRAQLLATAARLGHSLVDLYILAVTRRGNLNPDLLTYPPREVSGRCVGGVSAEVS